VYGHSVDQISDEWQYWMRQRYYPGGRGAPAAGRSRRALTELASSHGLPAARRQARRPTCSFLPRTATPRFYRRLSRRQEARRGEGERTSSSNRFTSSSPRLDVNPQGVSRSSSKYAEPRRAVPVEPDTARSRGAYQFAELVSILSRPGRGRRSCVQRPLGLGVLGPVPALADRRALERLTPTATGLDRASSGRRTVVSLRSDARSGRRCP